MFSPDSRGNLEMDLPHADTLSEPARAVLRAGGHGAYTRLVVRSEPGRAGADVRQMLSRLTVESVLSQPAASPDDAESLLSGLWLWNDFLHESHTISQSLHSPTGSFWHAIMHRREGDFSNAKYWYARCRNHPAISEVAERAGERWEPNAFVDLVERVHDKSDDDPRHNRAVELQRMEWEALFSHCLRAAAGPSGSR
jgi:hypothetical protein